jgi:lipid A ethanolaminephosphotransferase
MLPIKSLPGRIRLPAELAFVVGAPLLWLTFYNLRFWQETAAAMWHPSAVSVLFMVSLFVLVLFVQSLLLLFMPRRLLRPIACVLFIVAALVAYFSDTYGVFMDKDMLRNVFATDTAEASGLITARLIGYVVLLGIVPCVLILRTDLPDSGLKQRLKQRSIFLASVLTLSVVGLFALSAAYASFFREHKPVRYLLNPAGAVYGVANLLLSEGDTGKGHELVDVIGPVTRVPVGRSNTAIVPVSSATHRKPMVLFLVIGETARADNFQLGG